jgi:DNA repair protein RadD
MAIELRPYQARDVERLGAAYTGGARAVCYCLPTGGGKTVVFAYISSRVASKGRRTAILTHRRELVHQASGKLSMAGVPHGIIAAGLDRDHDAPTLVMSAATALRRFDQLPAFHVVVLLNCLWTRSAPTRFGVVLLASARAAAFVGRRPISCASPGRRVLLRWA